MVSLLDDLEETREGYDDECLWHAFLLDSYTGEGGYQGSVRQPPAGWWGAAAERYIHALEATTASSDRCYLDRYPREEKAKFDARKAIAHLWNFVEPITNLKLDYLLRKPNSYTEQPEDLAEWREDTDGAGTTWDEQRPGIALAAALWGWTPVLVDMDPAQPGESVAQARERGVGRPRMLPLMPASLRDYEHDGQGFVWAKVRTDHTERPAWNAKAVRVSVYRIWTPRSVATFEVRAREGADREVRALGEVPHPFGQVPIAIFRHSAWPGEAVRGQPMHSGPARAQKRLYNLLSELDEHMRSQVFALLVLAMVGDPAGGQITIGVDNSLPLDPNATQKHYYMSPDPGIAEVYERRIEATIRDGIYRAARVEYARPQAAAAAASGLARRYEFAQTNSAVAAFALEMARGEEWLDQIVWAGLGRPADGLDGYSIQAAQDFDIEDLAAEIDNAVTALSIDLGATMRQRVSMRLAERIDPQMPPQVREIVEAELAEVVAQRAVDAALLAEARAAAGDEEE